MEPSMEHSMHEHCAQKPAESPFARAEVAYDLPDVTLTDQEGHPFRIEQLASSDRVVALNFIFATCTTICPVMTATFAEMRRTLGEDVDGVRMVSITIDPEHDTPAVLAEYAARFDAPSDWAFLTGSSEDTKTVLTSFDALFGSKFNHHPVTVLHAPGQDQWVRLDGLGSGAALAEEVRALLPPAGVL